MQRLDSTNYVDPLDVLRRFIPTPLKAVYRIGSVRVIVETNDFTLLPILPLDAEMDDSGEASLDWKLVRDPDARGLLETPVFLSSGTLTVVEMGTACLVGLDHERRELLGFMGSDVDARTYQEFLVPFLCRMTNEALYGSVAGFSDRNDEMADA
jgi:hypothetical protein